MLYIFEQFAIVIYICRKLGSFFHYTCPTDNSGVKTMTRNTLEFTWIFKCHVKNNQFSSEVSPYPHLKVLICHSVN